MSDETSDLDLSEETRAQLAVLLLMAGRTFPSTFAPARGNRE